MGDWIGLVRIVVNHEVVGMALQTLSVAIAALVAELLRRAVKKAGLSWSREMDAKLDYYTRKAAAFVEEEARRRWLAGQDMTGPQKARLAAAKLHDWLAKDADLRQTATDWIQAQLPDARREWTLGPPPAGDDRDATAARPDVTRPPR